MHPHYRVFNSSKQTILEQVIYALKDVKLSFTLWRVALLMGIGDIRKRYSRSKLGQFWLTISFAIHILAVSLIWSLILHTDIKQYLPYFALGHMLWCYAQSYIGEGCLVYIGYNSYLRELSMPYFVYIYSLIVKNFIVLLHNLIVIIICFIICYNHFNLWDFFLSLLGFILFSCFLTSWALILGVLSLRFRDLPNIINSIVNIVFYATPIMWQIDVIPAKYQCYLLFNPIAVFIILCRDPWFTSVALKYWMYGAGYMGVSICLALLVFARTRNKITYWI